ncbi:MAG: L-serine ammonia-lyase [Thermoanaerobaculia bacterium]|nr:L-serine ammonia-lyase [Thermoanaerobaculia bacterium]
MSISVFDIFKIGIGPSSSHTVGPMKAARRFVSELADAGRLEVVHSLTVELYGSLALTGQGHGTDTAILLGLAGEEPETIDPDGVEGKLSRIRSEHRVSLLGRHAVQFDESSHLLFHRTDVLPGHANGMRFIARSHDGEVLSEEEMYSVGGGFVLTASELGLEEAEPQIGPTPHPFRNCDELMARCRETGLRVHELILENELTWRDEESVRSGLRRIWDVMQACVERGFRQEGLLPGVLKVPRRAPKLHRRLLAPDSEFPTDVMDWLSAWAIAVNEENAAGGRVVTAPTNGAAGIIPSVLHFYSRKNADKEPEEVLRGVERFLLTAGAIGILYKRNASISGAEMGCQGEVGVACSMAAGGLVSAAGGDNVQIENAAEIGMEHNLGLTCDPIAGLVQIPCIERNAMGAVKAVNAARMAWRGDGTHKVTLDQVITTMRQTGHDMQSSYKETSQGGLAVNVPEC